MEHAGLKVLKMVSVGLAVLGALIGLGASAVSDKIQQQEIHDEVAKQLAEREKEEA